VAARQDPRSSITPESFAVARELLGLPLARPWRRLAAFLFDLVPVAILANAGFFVFLACTAAIAVWRSMSPRRNRRVNALVRMGASLFTLVMVLRVGGVFDSIGQGIRRAEELPADSVASIVQSALARAGVDTPELDASPDPAPEMSPEEATSVVEQYAAAQAEGDRDTMRRLRPRLDAALASDRLRTTQNTARALSQRNTQLERENEDLQHQLENDSRGGVTGWIGAISDDLGIGFGWGALYFTTLLVMGRGQTPGKRLFGVRVIRLDARPIGWWLAFERFGSYFASLSTGLLGFAQIFWDRNRQALHDKAVETVVVRVRRHDHGVSDRLNAAQQ
jgi:RDD family